MGLFDAEDGWGTWDAHLQYYWTQTFPAHSSIHIRHEYTPVEGFGELPLETIKNALEKTEPAGSGENAKFQREDLATLRGFCPDPPLLRASMRAIKSSDPDNGQFVYPHWVDFILTSANTWRQPIEDFTLIIERGKPIAADSGTTLVSLCSPQNAPVEKLTRTTFEVHLTNFVPKSQLRIGYVDLPEPGPAAGK